VRPLPLSNENIDFLKRVLPQVDFFAPMTAEQLDFLLPFVTAAGYDYGETVFSEGDPGDAFYVIFRGAVVVKVKSGWLGGSRQVAKLILGQYFGEMALISGEPRSATVVCPEPAELLAVKAIDFALIVEQNPQVRELIERVARDRGRGR